MFLLLIVGFRDAWSSCVSLDRPAQATSGSPMTFVSTGGSNPASSFSIHVLKYFYGASVGTADCILVISSIKRLATQLQLVAEIHP